MSTVLIAGHAFSPFEWLRETLDKGVPGVRCEIQSPGLAGIPLKDELHRGSVVLLVFVEPAIGIGHALKVATGGPVPDATALLGAWCASAQAMLRLAARQPGRCLLVDGAAALSEPVRLCDLVAEASGLASQESVAGKALPVDGLTQLETLLARSLVSGDPAAAALHADLTGCAHLSADADLPATAGRPAAQSALSEYFELMRRSNTSAIPTATLSDPGSAAVSALEALKADHEARLHQLTVERDRETERANRQAVFADYHATELARQTVIVQHLRREGEGLLVQLRDAQRESEVHLGQAEGLRAESSALQAREAALVAAKESIQLQLAATLDLATARKMQIEVNAEALQCERQRLAEATAAGAGLSRRISMLEAELPAHRQIREERDCARGELTQINAELASLRESGGRMAAALSEAEGRIARIVQFWREQHPVELVVDLRRELLGSNWYPAEADGRWTGPGRRSTLELPGLRPGRYRLRLKLVGAMNAQIAAGLRIEVNGQLLVQSFNRVKHPRLAESSFEVQSDVSGPFVLGIEVPMVESPAAHGSPDQRLLGVRVAELTLTALGKP